MDFSVMPCSPEAVRDSSELRLSFESKRIKHFLIKRDASLALQLSLSASQCHYLTQTVLNDNGTRFSIYLL